MTLANHSKIKQFYKIVYRENTRTQLKVARLFHQKFTNDTKLEFDENPHMQFWSTSSYNGRYQSFKDYSNIKIKCTISTKSYCCKHAPHLFINVRVVNKFCMVRFEKTGEAMNIESFIFVAAVSITSQGKSFGTNDARFMNSKQINQHSSQH